MNWLTFFASVVAAIVSSQVMTPWVQAHLERRKRHQELITTWRAMIARTVRVDAGAIKLTAGAAAIVTDPDYWSLRGHLDPELVAWLENEGIDADGNEGITLTLGGPLIDERIDAVARAVDKLERRWRLV